MPCWARCEGRHCGLRGRGRSWRRAGALQGPRQVRQERPSRSSSAPETQEDTERFVYSGSTQLYAWHRLRIKASPLTRGHSHAGTAQAQLLRIRPSVSSVRPGLQRVQGGCIGLGSMQGRCHRSPSLIALAFVHGSLLLRCSSLFSPGPSNSPFPLSLSPFALFDNTVPLLHLLPAPPVGPAYPPPNLRLCERASPVAPPREEELASRRINHQLVCP